jgi:fucose permease
LSTDTAIVRRLRTAIATIFLLCGLSMATWVTPVIRDLIEASTAQMGLVLFGLAVGSMIGILTAGALITGLGARTVIIAGALGISTGLVVIGVGSQAGSIPAVTVGLGVLGLGVGAADVAMNVEAARAEERSGRPFLPLAHGCYSLGTLVGSGLGILAVSLAIPPLWHLLVTAVALAAVLVRAAVVLPPDTGRRPAPSARSAPTRRRTAWTDPRLLLIGFITLAMALAEGTANDWLPLIMVDAHGMDASLGSVMFAVFATAMTVGRFVGGPLVARLGTVRVLAASAAAGVAGLGLVALAQHPAVAVAAIVLWGLGTSLGFPVSISAAGASGPDQAGRIAIASMIGYVALLSGPPVLGFAGEHWGLRAALLIPLAVLVLAIPASRAARSRTARESRETVISTSRAGRRRSG